MPSSNAWQQLPTPAIATLICREFAISVLVLGGGQACHCRDVINLHLGSQSQPLIANQIANS
jgi:hypothetical protein